MRMLSAHAGARVHIHIEIQQAAVCTAVQLYTVRMILLFIKQNGSVYFSAQFAATTAVPRTPVSSAQNMICR